MRFRVSDAAAHVAGGQLHRLLFVQLPFAVAAAKGQQAQFVTRLNSGIATLRADGVWRQINDRWMGKWLPLPQFTNKRMKAIEAAGCHSAKPAAGG
jgi:ABC-type amino acid transport substrate-binding protein